MVEDVRQQQTIADVLVVTTPPADSNATRSTTPWTRARVAGADDRTRTGDLVLTKDALYLLSYIGPSSRSACRRERHGKAGPRVPGHHRPKADRPAHNTACLAEARRGRGQRGERRLERETGIEPATNSLEGCDSTTELLPPSRTLNSIASAGKPAFLHAPMPRVLRRNPLCPPTPTAGVAALPAAARRQVPLPAVAGEGLVARGGFEPPKALGRQIYSLLRLTAPQPRRCEHQRPVNSRRMLSETTPGGACRRRTVVPSPRPACPRLQRFRATRGTSITE